MVRATGGFAQYVTKCHNCLRNLDINCIHAFLATCSRERNNIAFADIVDQTCSVNKDFLFSGIVNDEAKALGFIEKFYCTSIHCKKKKKSDVAICRDKDKGVFINN